MAQAFETAEADRGAGSRRSADWLDRLESLPVLLLGACAAVASTAAAVRNALLHSLDFQWSPARLLVRHIDPWAVYLAGNPRHQILLNQVPNYLHVLYVFLLPFGALPSAPARLIWAAINILLVLAGCWCAARLFQLEQRRAWLLAILVLTGTPFRVTVGNGQATALVFLCIALWALAVSARSRGLLLGIAWVKYSVPPVLALFLLFRRRFQVLLWSLAPPAAGLLFFTLWLHASLGSLALEPFRCASSNVSPGLANAMAVAGIALLHPPMFRPVPDAFYLRMHGSAALLEYAAGTALACVIAALVSVRSVRVDGRIHLACLTAASLLCFKHQIYDFLLLTFCLAAALRAPADRSRNLLLLLIAYFWYFERLLHVHRVEFWPGTVLLSFALLSILLLLTWRAGSAIKWPHRWNI